MDLWDFILSNRITGFYLDYDKVKLCKELVLAAIKPLLQSQPELG
jgi:hypothetical protein